MEQSLPLFQVIDGRDTFCAVKVFDCIWCSAELVSESVRCISETKYVAFWHCILYVLIGELIF